MRSNIKKSRIIAIVSIPLAVLVLCLAIYGVTAAKRNDRLSEAQIEALRGEYPVYGTKLPPLVDMITPTMDRIRERVDTFIYGTIEGEMTVYSEYISTGDEKLDEKRERVGLGNTYDYYKYTLSVIEDTAGILQKGDKIELVANIEVVDYNPTFTDQMTVIVPASQEEEDPQQFAYSVYGTYYVTEDGYVVSAFDEQRAEMKESLNGIRVERLLDELKK